MQSLITDTPLVELGCRINLWYTRPWSKHAFQRHVELSRYSIALMRKPALPLGIWMKDKNPLLSLQWRMRADVTFVMPWVKVFISSSGLPKWRTLSLEIIVIGVLDKFVPLLLFFFFHGNSICERAKYNLPFFRISILYYIMNCVWSSESKQCNDNTWRYIKM